MPRAFAKVGWPKPFPSLIILDLNLPLKSGFEVLQWIRQESRSRPVPVVILTSSSQASDIQRAYELGASSYFIKPVAWSDLVERVRDIKVLWTDPPIGVPHA